MPGDDTLDILEQKRKEAGHQDYVAWLASCVHSDPFFGKTCERRANERSETYVALQKPTETIAVLTCSRGQQKAVPATSKQGKKVNCEYRTRLTKFRYEDAIYAEALQTHTNHEPGSGDYHEPETPRLKRALDDLYDLGFKPAKAVNVIKYQTGATRHDLTVEERHLLNKTMAIRVKKAYNKRQASGNDLDACEALYNQHREHFLYFERGDDVQIAICSPEQRKVMKACHTMVFADAVHCLNRKGDVTLALLVRDPYGMGFPVAYCICSGGEDSTKWKKFIRAVVDACDVQIDDITFMIDKSTCCISALDQLNCFWVLCAFHFMQSIGRKMKSHGSGVSGRSDRDKSNRNTIFRYVNKLRLVKDEGAFDSVAYEFMTFLENENLAEMKEYFIKNWMTISDRWSQYGRKHIAFLKSNTNNLIERLFRTVQEEFLDRERLGRRDSLILKFLDEVTPRYLDRLQKRLQGAEKANARVNQNKHLTGVDTCGRTMQPYCATGQGSLSDSCLIKFNVDNQMFYCCTGDLSCTCDDNDDDICMHVEAAMKKYPITYEMVRKVASVVKSRQHEYVQKMATPAPFHGAEDHHVELSDVEIEEDNTVYQCLPVCFYHLGPKPRRKYFVNMYYKTCTCHCFSFFGTCPHVIALGATDEDDMDPAEKLQKSVQIRNDTHVNAEWERALVQAFPAPSHGSSCDILTLGRRQITDPRMLTKIQFNNDQRVATSILDELPRHLDGRFMELHQTFMQGIRQLQEIGINECRNQNTNPAPAFNANMAYIPPQPSWHRNPNPSTSVAQYEDMVIEE